MSHQPEQNACVRTVAQMVESLYFLYGSITKMYQWLEQGQYSKTESLNRDPIGLQSLLKVPAQLHREQEVMGEPKADRLRSLFLGAGGLGI
jgi:hypothetical protein